MGKSAPSPPPAPDYAAAAKEQGQANIDAARITGKMSNPNVYSPYGAQTVQYGTLDQPAYDKAMATFKQEMEAYNARLKEVDALNRELVARSPAPPASYDSRMGTYRPPPPVTPVPYPTMPVAPDKAKFDTQRDQPSIFQTFSPEQQALYEQDVATRQQLGKLGLQASQSLEGLVGSPITYDYAAPLPAAYQAGAALTPGEAVPVLDPSMLPAQAAVSETPSALDLSGLPAAPGAYTAPTDLPPMPLPSADVYNRTYQATLARPMEDLARRREDLQSSLVARGLQGGRGYEREMDLQARAENDARMQAVLAANQAVQQQYGMDLATRQQAQQEALANAGLSYQQGMGLRQQSVDEQMRRFEQMMAGTGRAYEQQQALRAQAAAEQAAQFGQRMGVGERVFGQQLQAQQQQAAQAQLAYQQQADLRRAQIAEYLAQRQTPLNEISAALSQTQVQNPFAMPGYSGVNVAPAPVYQAVADKASYGSDLYNVRAQQAASAQSGLMGIGGAVGGAAMTALMPEIIAAF